MTPTQDVDQQRNQLGAQWMDTQEYDDVTVADEEEDNARTKKTTRKYGEGFDDNCRRGSDWELVRKFRFLGQF